ncbi:MAG TPA: RecX family transcriptional regulator [Allosphingosinicella sp.]|nr:RecX family transcriptional regulator [Allosphingosinicella sp.]
MAVTRDSNRTGRPRLDGGGLQRAALSYAGRHATTRARLRAYLTRKLRERGWAEEGAPPIEQLVERMAALGYVDDRAFAAARAESLGRRGYGERRVGDALRAAGIEEADAAGAREAAREHAWDAALRFAERKRIGPFAAVEPDRPAREKALGAMLRAGHPPDLARRLIAARPGEIPDADAC